jgi:uncharacterized membrane protein YeiH
MLVPMVVRGIILSTITGFAGESIRDIIFGKFQPIVFINPLYLIVTVVTGITNFYSLSIY